MKKYIILISLGLIFLSCEKKSDFYKAQIRVVNSKGVPVQNVTVRLRVPVGSSETLTGITNIDGTADFEIDNKAFYDIRTWKGNWRGCDYVEFNKNKTVIKTVVIRPWDDPYTGCSF